MNWPGTRPIHGDSVHLSIDTTTVLVFTGVVICQGVREHGRGYVELPLPDADPEQCRALQRCTSYQWDLHRDGSVLYSSPVLELASVRRTGDGSLVVKGAPGPGPDDEPGTSIIGRTSRRVYGSDHDDPDPGPRPGHTYAELTGGPLDGLLLDITGRDPGTALEVLLLRRVPRTGLCLLPASHGRPPARPAAADPAHMAVRALPDPGRPHRSGA